MNDKPANRHRDLRSLIRDDAYAASFQSLGQYRTALLELAAPAVQGEPVAVPQVMGIGRDTSLPRAVILYLRSEPTDDDIRSIQDALRTGWVQPAEQQPVRLPKRAKPQKDDSASIHGFCDGWNNCLDEVARLNGDRMANPEPDVAGLVEALDLLKEAHDELVTIKAAIGFRVNTLALIERIDSALAAHRKQGGEA